MRLALAGVFAALLLTGCAHHRSRPDGTARDNTNMPQSSRYSQAQDGAPSEADIERIDELPMPTPKAEPRSRYGNKSPYTVLGQTYRVLPTARGYHERGIASWYGTKFHGHLTSSFEPYDMYRFTAAHKTLPLPSYARVTNLDNGKSVIVRVNDRGPFHDNRIIDLSYAAAVRLDIWRQGTGLVDVEALQPGDPDLPPPSVQAVDHAQLKLYLQVGAFAEAANAERLARQLRDLRVGSVLVVTARVDGRTLRRVRIGPLDNVDAADQLADRIRKAGLPHAQAVIE